MGWGEVCVKCLKKQHVNWGCRESEHRRSHSPAPGGCLTCLTNIGHVSQRLESSLFIRKAKTQNWPSEQRSSLEQCLNVILKVLKPELGLVISVGNTDYPDFRFRVCWMVAHPITGRLCEPGQVISPQFCYLQNEDDKSNCSLLRGHI